MNEIEAIEKQSRRMESSSHQGKTPKLYKIRNESDSLEKKNRSGYVEDGRLLLEVKVTESLCAGMSTSCGSNEIDGEKGHVEVTIVRPRGASSRSINEKNASITYSKEAEENNQSVWVVKESSINNQRNSKLNASAPVEKSAPNQDGNFEPLIELGALYEMLDRLRPDDVESASVWLSSESCCREILQRFQNLLKEWSSDRERFDRCVASDGTLVKCENCGVIRRTETPKLEEKFPEVKSCEKVKNERPTRSKRNSVKISGMEIMKNSVLDEIVSPKREKTVHKFRRIPVWNRISTRTKDENKRDKKSTKNSQKKSESNSKNLTNSSPNNKSIETGNNSDLAETIGYLVRANSELEDEKSQAFSDKTKILKSPVFPEPKIERKPCFDFHGSRDVDFYRDSNFLALDDARSKSREKNRDVFVGGLAASRQNFGFCPPSEKEFGFNAINTSSSSSAENLIHQWIRSKNPRLKKRTKDKNSPEIVSREKSKDRIECKDLSKILPSTERRKIFNAKPVPVRSAKNPTVVVKDEKSEIDDQIENYCKTSKILTSETIEDCSKIKDSKELCSKAKSLKILGQDSKDSVQQNEEKYEENQVPIIFLNKLENSGVEKNTTSNVHAVSTGSVNLKNALVGNSEVFERQIFYDEDSIDDVVSHDSLAAVAASKVFSMYRKIIESKENMNWGSFERLVTALNPSQRELWSDICKAVRNEARRVAEETGATTEVCIEINPQVAGDKAQGLISTHDDEITFELDMTVQDLRTILKSADRSSTHEDEARNAK